MRRLLTLALFFAACEPAIIERPSPPPGQGAAPRSRFHRFKVQASAVPTEIRNYESRKEIARLPGAVGNGLKTQGLTTIRHSLATHTRFSTANGGGSAYGWFDDVILEVAISSVIIHIPKEYQTGSCEYEAVLEHERGHGRVAREWAIDVADKLERTLTASEGIPTRFDPVFATSVQEASDRLASALSKITDPVWERFEAEEKQAQSALDKPDPYDAVYQKCANWEE